MDKVEQFKTSLEDFLDHKEKNVLVIKGPWGVGKTYFWNDYVKKSTKYKNKVYSYVSLFGVSSLSEIQSSIFYNSSKIGNKAAKDTIKEKFKTISKYSKSIPQINKFSDAISLLEKSLLKNLLVCIDDIERKDASLSISSILGLISELSVDNECKFVLIFNDDTLETSDKKEFKKYREKVIDLELEYNPSIEHNQEIVFKEYSKRQIVYKTLYPLNLKNIRILKHIRWNLENFLKSLDGYEKEVSDEVVSTTTLLTYIHHEPSIEINIEDLNEMFSYRSELTDEQKSQKNTIIELGYNYFSEYEKELIKYIADGIYNKTEFLEEVNKLNDRQKQSNFQQELEDVWGLYNDNFRATVDDVIEGLTEFLNKHVEKMSYREIEPMISTINKLDNTIDTDVWINRFIIENMSSFSRNEIKFFKDLTTNTKIIEKLDKREQDIYSSNSIKDTLYKIFKESGWSNEDEQFLNSHTKEQLIEWLEKENDKNFLKILRSSLRTFNVQEGNTDRAEFGRKLHDAVRQIATRSSIDKIRVQDFFGIEI